MKKIAKIAEFFILGLGTDLQIHGKNSMVPHYGIFNNCFFKKYFHI